MPAAAHLLAGLLEDIPEAAGPCVDHEEVADRACAYADKVRADAACLEYPPSMVAVATVICALKATDAPIDVVQAWMARVEQVRLPYADAPDASARVMKCGLRILELNGLGDELRDVDACAADAEVEAARREGEPAVRDERALDNCRKAIDMHEATPRAGASFPCDLVAQSCGFASRRSSAGTRSRT